MEEPKKKYTRPDIVRYGDVHELTAGSFDGDALDDGYPQDTPKSDPLFS